MGQKDKIGAQSYHDMEAEYVRSDKVSKILGEIPASLRFWSVITLIIVFTILLILIIILPLPIEIISRVQNFIYHN